MRKTELELDVKVFLQPFKRNFQIGKAYICVYSGGDLEITLR
jgi:hypothetical protein